MPEWVYWIMWILVGIYIAAFIVRRTKETEPSLKSGLVILVIFLWPISLLMLLVEWTGKRLLLPEGK